MTAKRPGFVCGSPDSGCWHWGERAADEHEFGDAGLCQVCGLPLETFDAEAAMRGLGGQEWPMSERH